MGGAQQQSAGQEQCEPDASKVPLKSRLCWHFARGRCTHLGCGFAHGLAELGTPRVTQVQQVEVAEGVLPEPSDVSDAVEEVAMEEALHKAEDVVTSLRPPEAPLAALPGDEVLTRRRPQEAVSVVAFVGGGAPPTDVPVAIHILVKKVPEGKIFKLAVDQCDTIDVVKAKIHDKENTHDSLREFSAMTLDGVFLEGGRTLKDYNIQNMAMVHFL